MLKGRPQQQAGFFYNVNIFYVDSDQRLSLKGKLKANGGLIPFLQRRTFLR